MTVSCIMCTAGRGKLCEECRRRVERWAETARRWEALSRRPGPVDELGDSGIVKRDSSFNVRVRWPKPVKP